MTCQEFEPGSGLCMPSHLHLFGSAGHTELAIPREELEQLKREPEQRSRSASHGGARFLNLGCTASRFCLLTDFDYAASGLSDPLLPTTVLTELPVRFSLIKKNAYPTTEVLVRQMSGNESNHSVFRYWGLCAGVFGTCPGGTWSDFSVSTETTLKVPLASRV